MNSEENLKFCSEFSFFKIKACNSEEYRLFIANQNSLMFQFIVDSARKLHIPLKIISFRRESIDV